MRPLAITTPALLSALLAAQTGSPPPTLESLSRLHRAAIAKASQSADPGDYDKAFAAYITALEGFLKDGAKGRDKARTRFELVHALSSVGRRPDAVRTLKAFDTNTAAAVDCAQAAYFARMFQLGEMADGWIQVALAKEAPTRDRMELGVLLMSRLAEPKLAEKLFEQALAKAADPEAKAEVLWYRCSATREREDVPETAYHEALQALADGYPKTRYGRIAGDRLRAMSFRVGGDPLPFTLDTFTHGRFTLGDQRDKVVLVCFWVSQDPRTDTAMEFLKRLHGDYGGRGLVVVGISLDEDAEQARRAVAGWKPGFPLAHVEGGFESDLALRYRVEDTLHCFLVGRDGKLAGMNFAVHDEYGQRQTNEAVRKALGIDARKGPDRR